MWIAEFSESSNLWTHLALLGIPRSMPVWVSVVFQPTYVSCWVRLGCGGNMCRPLWLCHGSAPLKCISGAACNLAIGVINISVPSGVCLVVVWLPTRSVKTLNWISWPQIRWDYPLNLSISISGGKETNKDSLSNCEWSGKSSNLKSGSLWLSEL